MVRDSLMDARPRRTLDWREDAAGCCVLLRPKFGSGRFGRWLARRVDDPHYRIRLDEVGTFVWKRCDGQTSLTAIADGLRRRFGAAVEPAEQRLTMFVGQMTRSRLLTYE